jgi:ubiquinone biosynthesis monooxygenase Coq7
MTRPASGEGPRPRSDPALEALMPGDPGREETIARMIRVDQAGEYGAKRIYAGQLAVLGRTAAAPALRRMAEQEQRHLDEFNRLMAERRVRPTLLQPLWHVAGFALGAATAMLGEKAAMACTVAVEETIDEHYRRQAARLGEAEPKLKDAIEEFREDELEHRATALAHGAQQAPAYQALTAAVKRASRLAIWLSERF